MTRRALYWLSYSAAKDGGSWREWDDCLIERLCTREERDSARRGWRRGKAAVRRNPDLGPYKGEPLT